MNRLHDNDAALRSLDSAHDYVDPTSSRARTDLQRILATTPAPEAHQEPRPQSHRVARPTPARRKLRGIVTAWAAGAAPTPSQEKVRAPIRRRTLAMGAAAAVATVGVMAWTASSGGSPAYAIDKDSAGDVSFSLIDPKGAEELEVALAEYGVTADITVLPRNEMCAPGRFPGERDWPIWLPLPDINRGEGETTQRIPAGYLEEGQTFVVVYMGTLEGAKPGDTAATSIAIADGPVADCIPTPVSGG